MFFVSLFTKFLFNLFLNKNTGADFVPSATIHSIAVTTKFFPKNKSNVSFFVNFDNFIYLFLFSSTIGSDLIKIFI